MLATMFLLASFVVLEPAVAFSIFMSHLMPLFTVVFGIRQTARNVYPVPRGIARPCVQQSIAFSLIGLFN